MLILTQQIIFFLVQFVRDFASHLFDSTSCRADQIQNRSWAIHCTGAIVAATILAMAATRAQSKSHVFAIFYIQTVCPKTFVFRFKKIRRTIGTFVRIIAIRLTTFQRVRTVQTVFQLIVIRFDASIIFRIILIDATALEILHNLFL